MSMLVAVHLGQILIDGVWRLLLQTRHLDRYVSYIISFCWVINRVAVFNVWGWSICICWVGICGGYLYTGMKGMMGYIESTHILLGTNSPYCFGEGRRGSWLLSYINILFNGIDPKPQPLRQPPSKLNLLNPPPCRLLQDPHLLPKGVRQGHRRHRLVHHLLELRDRGRIQRLDADRPEDKGLLAYLQRLDQHEMPLLATALPAAGAGREQYLPCRAVAG